MTTKIDNGTKRGNGPIRTVYPSLALGGPDTGLANLQNAASAARRPPSVSTTDLARRYRLGLDVGPGDAGSRLPVKRPGTGATRTGGTNQ